MSSTTSSNSFVRSKYDDKVGSGGITALSKNNFVASSPLWNNGAATTAGAVTCGNGASGSAWSGHQKLDSGIKCKWVQQVVKRGQGYEYGTAEIYRGLQDGSDPVGD
ncbi:MAG: hypothetical protein NT142_04665, partial [Planctomycetota bacterium]|nr:hypothetical protein [Planctomycetota bacterium]